MPVTRTPMPVSLGDTVTVCLTFSIVRYVLPVAFVYSSGKDSVVFLENQAPRDTMLVWKSKSYIVPGESTSIVKNDVEIFNSA